MKAGCRLRLCVMFFAATASFSQRDSVLAVKIHTSKRKPVGKEEDRRRDVNKMKSWLFGEYSFNLLYSEHQTESTFSQLFQEKFATAYDAIVDEIQPLRDAWDGFHSAYRLMWTGYYQGFGSLFLEFPWEGFERNGILGFFTGTAGGIVHFASMTTNGIAAGLYQAVKGFESSLDAFRATKDGKVWHNIKKEWFFYSLDDEAESAESSQSSRSSKRHLRKRVKDDRFYQLLDIPVDATRSDVKRAYYRQALAVHPDKSSETEAVEHFRILNTAYRTLVTQESRDLYDSHGVCHADYALSEASARVDPYTFFSILFGTGVVEPYVGDLAIASIVDNALVLTERADASADGDSIYESQEQLRRQIQIASHLRDRIHDYASDSISQEAFQSSCRSEAESLALAIEDSVQAEFLLRSISSGMIAATAEYTVSAWAKPLLAIFSTSLLDVAKNAKLAYDLENEIRRAIRESDKAANSSVSSDECSPGTSDLDGILLHLAVPRALKLVWKFNSNDVTRTVREACKRVIDDSAGDHGTRLRRARALNVLGREFYLSIKTRDAVYGEAQWEFPDKEFIQESVRSALIEAVVSESFE